MPLVLVLIVLAVIVAVAVALVFRFGQRSKGSIALDLSAGSYQAGDLIQGVIHLEAKKALGPGRLLASLVCTEKWWEWDTDADGDQTRRERTREVYNHGVEVTRDLSLMAGEQRPIEFALPTPPPAIPGQDPSGVVGFIKSVAGALKGDRERIWTVEIRYDIPGLDLTESRRIAFQEPG
jgi:hypothetical protein